MDVLLTLELFVTCAAAGACASHLQPDGAGVDG